jgi:hypothetical protein
MGIPKPAPAPSQRPGHPPGGNGATVSRGIPAVAISARLLAKARADTAILLHELASSLEGLSQAEADARLKRVGPNEIAREKRQSPLRRLLGNVKNPLVILLVALGGLPYLTGDLRATAVILVMVLLGVVLRFFQELLADNAAEKLTARVSNTATVVPADVRLLAVKDPVSEPGGAHRRGLAAAARPESRREDPARLAGRKLERFGAGRSRHRRQRLCQAGPGPQGPPMWAFRRTARWTSPRSRPTSSCWKTAC